jgi:hypothetical protein
MGGHLRPRLDGEVGDALQPFLQGDLQLAPRQVRADAAVRPGREGEVPVGRAMKVDLVRPGSRR